MLTVEIGEVTSPSMGSFDATIPVFSRATHSKDVDLSGNHLSKVASTSTRPVSRGDNNTVLVRTFLVECGSPSLPGCVLSTIGRGRAHFALPKARPNFSVGDDGSVLVTTDCALGWPGAFFAKFLCSAVELILSTHSFWKID
jgi:hypothetical protein